MNRIAIIGTSCSGKTTLATAVSKIMDYHHIELDRLHWLPNWIEREDDEMRSLLAEELKSNRQWVSDGNYSIVRPILWKDADTIIWLKYSFLLTFYRGLKRSITRVITGELVCNGNKESFATTFFSKDSILYWILTTYHRRIREYPKLFEQEGHHHLKVIIHNHPRETKQFLKELEQTKRVRAAQDTVKA